MIVELATIGGALVGIYWMARIGNRKQSEARQARYEAEAAQVVDAFVNGGRIPLGWRVQVSPTGDYEAEMIKVELGYVWR